MSKNSKIEWCDDTWNPVRGCSRKSEGCRNCYAERVAARFSGKGLPYEGLTTNGKFNGNVRFIPGHLHDPLRWTEPRMIFVNSMSDLFHENLADETIDQIFAVMALAPQHTFQVLTKRPDRMREYFAHEHRATIVDAQYVAQHPEVIRARETGKDWTRQQFAHLVEGALGVLVDVPEVRLPLPNVWLGVSVEDQGTADERIPELLRTPAAVRFVSYEPALGAVNFGLNPSGSNGLHWVICGGESGAGARPMHPDWARSARDQCQAAGVAFFFKQWGEWAQDWAVNDPDLKMVSSGFPSSPPLVNQAAMRKVGKKAAGRTLDGETYSEFPSI